MQKKVTNIHIFARQPLSDFGKIAVGALLGTSILCGLLSIVAGLLLLIIAASVLVVAALIASGIRWMPLLGCLMGVFILYAFLFKTSFPIYHLSHPKDAVGSIPLSFALFVVILIILWCNILAFSASIAALLQNYLPGRRRTMLRSGTAMAGMIGVLIGAILIGALAQPGAGAVAATSTNGEPTVHLSIASFSPSSITIPKGSKLLLVDDGTFHHNLSNGAWVNGQPQAENQPGAPRVNSLDINGTDQSVEIGPFTTSGTYRIYCTIHSGMTLTILVQ